VMAIPVRKAGSRTDKLDPATFICKYLPVFRPRQNAMRGDQRRLALVLLQT
jgi:hypothetical protein